MMTLKCIHVHHVHVNTYNVHVHHVRVNTAIMYIMKGELSLRPITTSDSKL